MLYGLASDLLVFELVQDSKVGASMVVGNFSVHQCWEHHFSGQLVVLAGRVQAQIYIGLSSVLDDSAGRVVGFHEVSLPHSGKTAIRKYQESDLFTFLEKVEDILQSDDTVFHSPVSFVLVTVACVVDAEALVSACIGDGFICGVPYGLQYGLSVGDTVGCTYDQVLKTVSPVGS